MRYHLTAKSSNRKTGPIPVTVSAAATCAPSCPFRNAGCYAEHGHVALHWHKVTRGERGGAFSELLAAVRALESGQVWRHNVAGDLTHSNGVIDADKLQSLADANLGRRGFTYTHHDTSHAANRRAIARANGAGFVVNLSANNLRHADELVDAAVGPVVVTLPADHIGKTATPAGRPVLVCPAVTRPGVTCSTCKLCARANRRAIVGFPLHGSGAGRAHAIVNN